MPVDLEDAWSDLHDAKPPGWYLCWPSYNDDAVTASVAGQFRRCTNSRDVTALDTLLANPALHEARQHTVGKPGSGPRRIARRGPVSFVKCGGR